MDIDIAQAQSSATDILSSSSKNGVSNFAWEWETVKSTDNQEKRIFTDKLQLVRISNLMSVTHSSDPRDVINESKKDFRAIDRDEMSS
jgi:hypothetical protein